MLLFCARNGVATHLTARATGKAVCRNIVGAVGVAELPPEAFHAVRGNFLAPPAFQTMGAWVLVLDLCPVRPSSVLPCDLFSSLLPCDLFSSLLPCGYLSRTRHLNCL